VCSTTYLLGMKRTQKVLASSLPKSTLWVDELASHLDGYATVFHFAASVGNKRSIDNPVRSSQVNAIDTLNLPETARKHGVPMVVLSSSAGIFGELRTVPVREDHPLDPDPPYGVSKLAEVCGFAFCARGLAWLFR